MHYCVECVLFSYTKKYSIKPKVGSTEYNLAERRGFEPPVRFRTHAFQACTFDHSDTSPSVGLHIILIYFTRNCNFFHYLLPN